MLCDRVNGPFMKCIDGTIGDDANSVRAGEEFRNVTYNTWMEIILLYLVLMRPHITKLKGSIDVGKSKGG